ncbi:hypothetical protein D3C77_474550 [compost metagenome]
MRLGSGAGQRQAAAVDVGNVTNVGFTTMQGDAYRPTLQLFGPSEHLFGLCHGSFTSLTGYGSLYARGGLPDCANAGCTPALLCCANTDSRTLCVKDFPMDLLLYSLYLR